MSKQSSNSDQSASMGDSEENEADTSFLDEDFLSFAAADNGGSQSSNPNNGVKKRSRSNSPVPQHNNGRFVGISVPWFDRANSSLQQQQQQQGRGGSNGRGYNSYYEPPALIKLHNEMVSFVKLMEPTKEELKVRDMLVNRITDLAVRTFGKKCKVLPFGSQVTGLCLPKSDIDFVIRFPDINSDGKSKSDAIEVDNDDEEIVAPNPLHTLAKAVRDEFGIKSELHATTDSKEEYLSYLEVIEQTRVPLVKFTIEPYNIDIDVCFDQPGGPESADLMHRFMGSMAPLRPLTFVLKYFLASRDLNKPYTGGIGSYMLQLMIVSFLQHRSREDLNRTGKMDSSFNLGSLLVDFFEFYGLDMNYVTTGISVRQDGYFFAKGERDKKGTFWQPNRSFSLAIENPLDPGMDVGAGAFRIQNIQRVFQHSFQTLLAYVAEPRMPTDSILARIIPPTQEMEERRIMKLVLAEMAAESKSDGASGKNENGRNSRWESPKKRKSEKRGSESSSSRHGRKDRGESPKKRKKDRRDSGGSNKRDKRWGR